MEFLSIKNQRSIWLKLEFSSLLFAPKEFFYFFISFLIQFSLLIHIISDVALLISFASIIFFSKFIVYYFISLSFFELFMILIFFIFLVINFFL